MFIKCKTDKGMIRSNNEDYVLSFRGSKYDLLIVADGMGGHNAGEIASKMAATTIRDHVFENFNITEDKEELLRDAILKANSMIYNEQISNEEIKGMGTTTTCCLIIDNNLFVGHVGDSRAYISGRDDIRKITVDHSFVQELIKNGSITEEEAFNHPQGNLITRSVGTEENIIIDIYKECLSDGDVVIICSDGLTSYVRNNEIHEIVLRDREKAVDELITLANQRGGNDNISVIIAGREDRQ